MHPVKIKVEGCKMLTQWLRSERHQYTHTHTICDELPNTPSLSRSDILTKWCVNIFMVICLFKSEMSVSDCVRKRMNYSGTESKIQHGKMHLKEHLHECSEMHEKCTAF